MWTKRAGQGSGTGQRVGTAWAFGFAAVLCLSLVGCRQGGEVSEGVQLVVEPATLEPTSTIELRFDAAMVGASAVGKAAESPLTIRPALAGTYTWLSRRSGVFRPSEPPGLGVEYELGLRHGLRQADGQVATARLRRVLRTPGLQVIDPVAWAPRWGGAHPLTELRLVFNAAVRAEEAGRYIRYRSAGAGEMAAEVRAVTLEEFAGHLKGLPPSMALRHLPLTWRQRFELMSAGADRVPAGLPLDRTNAWAQAVGHCLDVRPARPLSVGQGWELVVEAGLGSTETTARLPSAVLFPLGDVVAFAATNVAAESGLHSGRKILVEFSKAIAPDVASSNVLEWMSVEPAPEDLSAAVQGQQVRLLGEFELGKTYTVRVRPGLRSAEPQVTEGEYKSEARFEPLPPRLYWPGTAVEQLAVGRRVFPLLAVNAGEVEVKAKRLDASVLVHALRGYRSYWDAGRSGRGWSSDEPYARVDYNVVPGRTVYQKTFELTNAVDEARTVPLAWDEVLGPGRGGAVFVQAETTGSGGPGWGAGIGSERRAGEGLPWLAPAVPMMPGAGAQRVGVQALVQVTDLGLVWKQAPGEVWGYVFSHRSGLGLPGSELRWVTDENEVLASGRTDASGLVRLATVSTGAWFVVEHASDLRGVEAGSGRVYLGRHGLEYNEYGGAGRGQPRVLLYSDRPVYRPGDTLQLAALAREWRGGRLRYPEGRAARLRCFTARGQEFLETNLTLSAAGSLAYAVSLPRVSQGMYRAQLTLGEAEYEHTFHVRDYRPNAFDLVLTNRGEFGPGEAIEVGVKARYLFGAPVTKGQLHWRFELHEGPFAPEAFGGFEFCGAGWGERGSLPSWGTVVTGRKEYTSRTNVVVVVDPGKAASTGPVAGGPARQPCTGEMTVELTDLNQQSLVERVGVTVHSSDFYLGLRRPPEAMRVGTNVAVEVVAVGRDGQPWKESVRAKVRLRRVEWRTVRVESAGYVVDYRNEFESTTVGEKEVVTRPVVLSDDQWQIAAGAEPAETFPLEQAGQYLLEAEAEDPAGRAVATTAVFHVAGEAELAWDYRNEIGLDLVPDGELYEAGDTATVLVKAPFSGRALVTVEREAVLRAWVTNLLGNAPAIDVPLVPGDAPNVYVSVLLVRGSADSPLDAPMPEHRLGYCRLNVAEPETELDVRVKADAEQYRPGAPVQVMVEVKGSDARPVAGAEVTVYAVDEGVLGLTGYSTPDPHGFFYHGEPLGVETGLTLPSLLPEDPVDLSYQNKGYIIGDGGGDEERVRRSIQPCAFWGAGLKTDQRGQVRVGFNAPDSLTRYRVMGVAAAGESQFGAGATEFRIDKPLMIEPAVPPVARVGDRLGAHAMVVNRTERSGEVEVVLALDERGVVDGGGGSATDGGGAWTNRVALGAQASVAVDAPVRLVAVGPASWTWTVRWVGGGEDRDATRTTVEVGNPAPLLREVHLLRVGRGAANLLAGVNPQLLEGVGEVVVRVGSTRMAQLGEAAARLLEYPYGCVEQTASSLMPWILAQEAGAAWLRGAHRMADVAGAIRAGVQRLGSMQRWDGGLSYWPGSGDSMYWGSAYAGVVLGVAKRRGQALTGVDEAALARYLEAGLRDAGTGALVPGVPTPAASQHERCLGLLALALLGEGQPAYVETLFNQRSALDRTARAWLALAAVEGGGLTNRAEELLRTVSSGGAEEADAFGCHGRELGSQLLAWTRVRPESPEVDRLVAELGGGIQSGHWGSTQGNAWALYALAEYAGRVERGTGPATGRLKVGAVEESVEIGAEGRPFEWRQRWPQAGGALSMTPTLIANGDRPLYVEVTVEGQPPVWSQPAQDRGYVLSRRYAVLDEDGKGREPVEYRVGDRVLVTLDFEARQAARYVVVDDPLPAVFEPVNPEFKSQAAAGLDGVANDWVSSHRELRADRAVFFCDDLRPGRYRIQYLARVRSLGRVAAPAAKIEEMYRPSRLGLTATGEVVVQGGSGERN